MDHRRRVLHAVGIIGIPGTSQSLYGTVPYYDHLTHALSASVVAGVGYTTVRAFDEHSDGIHLPSRFTFVFVMAFGVVWELVEFSVDVVGSATGFGATGFTQHSLNDTMLNLVFNTMGVVVGIWGTVYLTDLVSVVRGRLEAREDG